MVMLLGWFAYFKGWIFANFTNISPQNVHELLSKPNKLLLIDVRSKEAFAKDHLENARNIPLEELEKAPIEDIEMIVYSERGEDSVNASRILSNRGYQGVYNLEGGVVFWIRAGYGVVKDSR